MSLIHCNIISWLCLNIQLSQKSLSWWFLSISNLLSYEPHKLQRQQYVQSLLTDPSFCFSFSFLHWVYFSIEHEQTHLHLQTRAFLDGNTK